jgi:hypothetical protein
LLALLPELILLALLTCGLLVLLTGFLIALFVIPLVGHDLLSKENSPLAHAQRTQG